jgi:hypothetical protein
MQSVNGKKYNGKLRKLVKQKYIPQKNQIWFILVFVTKMFKENTHYYILDFFKNAIIKRIEIYLKIFIKIPNFNDLINLLKNLIVKIHI